MGRQINMDISNRQRQILQYIRDFQDARGASPSFREIGAAFNLTSPATISAHMEKLARYGYIIPPRGKRRCLQIINNG